MQSIGEILKEEREKQSLSLQGVYESTRITIQNIVALEDNKFNSFPNKVYARAFLRDYCNFLGVDSGEMLDRYELEWNNSVEVSVNVEKDKYGSGRWAYVVIILAVVFIASAFGLWYYYDKFNGSDKINKIVAPEYEDRNKEQDNIATLPKLPINEPESVSSKPVGQNEPNITPPARNLPSNTQVSSQLEKTTYNGLVLNVATIGKAWVRIKADNKLVYIGILDSGVSKEIKANQVINIRTGNAGVVQAKLNGKSLGVLGEMSAIADKTYKLSDVKVNGR